LRPQCRMTARLRKVLGAAMLLPCWPGYVEQLVAPAISNRAMVRLAFGITFHRPASIDLVSATGDGKGEVKSIPQLVTERRSP
jgi:hypothetical protein